MTGAIDKKVCVWKRREGCGMDWNTYALCAGNQSLKERCQNKNFLNILPSFWAVFSLHVLQYSMKRIVSDSTSNRDEVGTG